MTLHDAVALAARHVSLHDAVALAARHVSLPDAVARLWHAADRALDTLARIGGPDGPTQEDPAPDFAPACESLRLAAELVEEKLRAEGRDPAELDALAEALEAVDAGDDSAAGRDAVALLAGLIRDAKLAADDLAEREWWPGAEDAPEAHRRLRRIVRRYAAVAGQAGDGPRRERVDEREDEGDVEEEAAAEEAAAEEAAAEEAAAEEAAAEEAAAEEAAAEEAAAEEAPRREPPRIEFVDDDLVVVVDGRGVKLGSKLQFELAKAVMRARPRPLAEVGEEVYGDDATAPGTLRALAHRVAARLSKMSGRTFDVDAKCERLRIFSIG